MKKVLSLLLALIISIYTLTSCSVVYDMLDAIIGDDSQIEPPPEEEKAPDNEEGTKPRYKYNGFTASEKALFEEYVGAIIPFAPNDEYYVEEYELDWGDEYEVGVNFYTVGNTKAEFEEYKTLFSRYAYDGSDTDDYGDKWYYYTADEGFYIDLSYFYDEGDYVIDVYVYYLYESGDSGEGGGSGSTEITDGVITNEGAGLPDGVGGVHRVDFTKAEKVKDVTDQGYYIDGCPTTGKVPVLVIPVDFSDATAVSKGYSINNIKRAFTGNDTDYYSVEEYYYISSYQALDLEFTVLDEWFRPNYSSSYYESLTEEDYYGEEAFIGDQVILDEALAYLENRMDLSKFDSDGNGIIDAVVMINSLTVDDTSDFHWAYRYWNTYTDYEGYYYEYDGVSANDFLWMSYGFMHESYDDEGNASYTDESLMNTYTYIHEFGHILGADDYYDTEYESEYMPLDSCDIMDGMAGDHNPYTKFNLGWITEARLVTTKSSVTLTLESFTESGDAIIIANNFDEDLGAYQEYYVVVYYTMSGLNGGDYGYFSRDGIIVYHVNASLYCEEYDGDIYYDVYNNNTSYTGEDGYGTVNNLIEFVKSADDNFTFVEGDSLPRQTDDLGDNLSYTFTIDALTEDSATITFAKN